MDTEIEVRNLFYNTPVRYKFLKKDYTEAGYIEDVITRIALVNPNIAIKLINTGKTVAKYLEEYLNEKELYTQSKKGNIKIELTKKEEEFSRIVNDIFKEKV